MNIYRLQNNKRTMTVQSDEAVAEIDGLKQAIDQGHATYNSTLGWLMGPRLLIEIDGIRELAQTDELELSCGTDPRTSEQGSADVYWYEARLGGTLVKRGGTGDLVGFERSMKQEAGGFA